MVSKEQIENGLAKYLDEEFLAQLHVEPWKQFAIATAASVAIKRVGAMLDRPVLHTLALVNDEGLVDIDVIAAEAKAKMPQEGLKVQIPMLGSITLHAADIDSLYRKINGGA